MPAKKPPQRNAFARLVTAPEIVEAEEDLAHARLLALEEIEPNPQQFRQVFNLESIRELADSIAAQGLIEPLVVRPKDGKYEVVAGERRLRALRLLAEEQPDKVAGGVLAIVRNLSDIEAAEQTAAENLQREDLTISDEAAMYEQLSAVWGLDSERSSAEIARRLGITRVRVWRARRIGKYPTLAAKVSEQTMTLRQALDQVQILEDVENGRTPGIEDNEPSDIERAELEMPEIILHDETLMPDAETENTMFHGETIAEAPVTTVELFHRETLVRPAPIAAIQERLRPRPAPAVTWRPLFLAQRNVSRLVERVTTADIKQLPRTERPSLIRTVDQAITELQNLKIRLEASDVD